MEQAKQVVSQIKRMFFFNKNTVYEHYILPIIEMKYTSFVASSLFYCYAKHENALLKTTHNSMHSTQHSFNSLNVSKFNTFCGNIILVIRENQVAHVVFNPLMTSKHH